MRRSRFVGPSILVSALSVFASCGKDGPTIPDGLSERSPTGLALSKAHSAALLSGARTRTNSPETFTTTSTISLKGGDSIVVTVETAECSGNPETVKVHGVISGVVASASCPTLAGTVSSSCRKVFRQESTEKKIHSSGNGALTVVFP